MFAFALAIVSLLPLQNNFLSNNTVVAQASETKSDNASDARLTIETMRLVVGKERVLSARNLNRDAGEFASFKSSDTKIVTVNQDTDSSATIVAEKVGEASITITIKDAKKRAIKTLNCDVTVGPPAQSVKFSESDVTISLSDKSDATTLKAVLKPGTTEEKPKVTVSKDGVISFSNEASVSGGTATITVKGLEVGKITLTISLENGLTDTCTIQVVK